jgi:GrpB-like predicted nucleotidyltransferase (UPF0157 family)
VLSAAIGGWAVGGIHHVGRTAVPGMGANSVIDILVGVLDLSESAPFLDRLAAVRDELAQRGYLRIIPRCQGAAPAARAGSRWPSAEPDRL